MQNDIRLTQPLMERIFPDMLEQKHKPVLFSLTNDGYGMTKRISILIRPAPGEQDIFRASNGFYTVQTSCFIGNENGKYRLTLQFDFVLKERIFGFQSDINPNSNEGQGLINALKYSDNIILWVVDNESQVIKVIEISWDYNKHKKTFNDLHKRCALEDK